MASRTEENAVGASFRAMKAIVQSGYGPPRDVLRLDDVDRPTVGDDHVLVRVRAAAVNPADWHGIRGDPYVARLSFGLRGPKDPVPGADLAGEVEAVGGSVTTLETGDEVFGSPFMKGLAAFGEFASVPASSVAPKPANLSFEQAAAVPVAGVTALQGLRDHGKVEAGHKVLIIGASGGVGTFAVQIAKVLGAEVTGVCSGGNAELVRSLGADHVIDYTTQEDFTQGGPRYDVVFQLAGTASPSVCRRALKPKGTLVGSSGEPSGRFFGPLGRAIKGRLLSPLVSQTLLSFTVQPNTADLERLKELIETNEVAPVIDRRYPLAEVPEALAYLETGRARGKVVIGL
jgi:NADPH:quinone reductase-like Zn-dependent oxidoreductase